MEESLLQKTEESPSEKILKSKFKDNYKKTINYINVLKNYLTDFNNNYISQPISSIKLYLNNMNNNKYNNIETELDNLDKIMKYFNENDNISLNYSYEKINELFNDIDSELLKFKKINSKIDINNNDNFSILTSLNLIECSIDLLDNKNDDFIEIYKGTKETYWNKITWVLGYPFSGLIDSDFGFTKRGELFNTFKKEIINILKLNIVSYKNHLNDIKTKNKQYKDDFKNFYRIIKENYNDKLNIEINDKIYSVELGNIEILDYKSLVNIINEKFNDVFDNNIKMDIAVNIEDNYYYIKCNNEFKILDTSTIFGILGFDKLNYKSDYDESQNIYFINSTNNINIDKIKEEIYNNKIEKINLNLDFICLTLQNGICS